MAAVKDSFLDLERQRLRLEEKVAALKKSLDHWQKWEIEYEGLKEEILGLGVRPSRKELEDLSKAYDGEVLDEREIRSMLGNGRGDLRNVEQILGVLSRRVDYVQTNCETVAKQVQDAESKLSAILVVLHPDDRNEEGLPVTEIREELDDDGEIISHTLTRPGDATHQMVEALRKAGIKDLPKVGGPKAGQEPDPTETHGMVGKSLSEGPMSNNELTEMGPRILKSANSGTERARKKSVSFANDTKSAEYHIPKPSTSTKSHTGFESQVRRQPNNSAHRIIELSDDNDHTFRPPETMEVNTDSPEEAALRKQMLRYNMEEVGNVVAQIDLEEDLAFSSASESDAEDDEYASAADDDDEDEDEHGRTTCQMVDEDYRRQMEELENKINAQLRSKSGLPPPVFESAPSLTSDSGDELVEDHVAIPTAKKGVRFAEVLDISSETRKESMHDTQKGQADALSRPISDKVVERVKSTRTSAGPADPKPRGSRFPQARISPKVSSISQNPTQSIDSEPASIPIPTTTTDRHTSQGVSAVPQGSTHATTITERPEANQPKTVRVPDELDPSLLHQEVAVEYHKMRNRMIQRNGGYSRQDEERERNREAIENSSGKRISRFKAARLR